MWIIISIFLYFTSEFLTLILLAQVVLSDYYLICNILNIHILELLLYGNSGCSKNVRVGYGMVKLLQLQEETRTRLGRKFIILTDPREGGLTCHEGSQGKYRVLVRWQKAGVRERPRSEPLLGFPRKGQSRARPNGLGGANWKGLGGLWAIVLVSGFLVPGPGMISVRGSSGVIVCVCV